MASTEPSSVTARPATPVPPLVVIAGFTLLAVSFMINAMDRQVFYPLLPDIRTTYGFSLSEGGLLATGFTLGMAGAGLPAGYLADRVSRKTLLVISIVIYSVGTLLTPAATGFADMAVYRLVSGFGEGMQATALYAAIGAFFFVRRSLMLGLFGFAFGAGVFFGPIIGTSLAGSYGTWHAPFIAFGSVGLLLAVLIGLFVGRRLTEAVAGAAQRETVNYDYLPASPYNRNTRLLAVATAAGGLTVYGFLGLYPTYLRTELHVTPGQTALATSLIGAGAATSLLSGWLADRFDPRKVLLVTYAGLAVSAWFVFNGADTPTWHYVTSFIMATFGLGSLFTNCNSTIQRSVRPEHVGRAAGLFVTTYYVPAAVSGYVFAELVDVLGWTQAALWQFTIVPLAALIPLWFVRSAKIIRSVT
ncbi:MFS transporter [Kibdelosporangium aridum]|uniref:Sugar phosphate permease n=1 Tax=Kibdelosporangium aridum TaxID=2030 RepID=A0A1W2FUQ1_KIBAR|nr:MFS transporter [Kibdelosporangium aridum]SMD25356.1 Sugar phosphate permease [Kibdelosporangium aridum]